MRVRNTSDSTGEGDSRGRRRNRGKILTKYKNYMGHLGQAELTGTAPSARPSDARLVYK